MFSLFPKDKKFTKLLNQLAEQTYESAVQLDRLLHATSMHDEVSSTSAIVTAKAQAKGLSIEITNELCRSFVTPFDREDIQELAEHLYKIPKTVEKIMERLKLHKLSGGQEDFYPQIELIRQEAEIMRDMVAHLANRKKQKHVLEKVTLLNQLEQKGDDVRQDLLGKLYNSERDIRDLLIRRDIYDMLERVVDRFRDVAGVAMQIVLKNS